MALETPSPLNGKSHEKLPLFFLTLPQGSLRTDLCSLEVLVVPQGADQDSCLQESVAHQVLFIGFDHM